MEQMVSFLNVELLPSFLYIFKSEIQKTKGKMIEEEIPFSHYSSPKSLTSEANKKLKKMKQT
jgi:hypothetical protein